MQPPLETAIQHSSVFPLWLGITGIKLDVIKDSLGNWIADENEIKRHIKCGFEGLSLTELSMSPMSSSISTFSCYFLFAESCSSIGSVVWMKKSGQTYGP